MAQSSRRLPLNGRSSLGNSFGHGSSPTGSSLQVNKGTHGYNSQIANAAAPAQHNFAKVDPLSRLSSRQLSPRLSSATDDPRCVTMNGAQDINIEVGDPVFVPGGMSGTVKYIGNVKGKGGIFAGVELDKAFAARGKNDGHVEGYARSIAGVQSSTMPCKC